MEFSDHDMKPIFCIDVTLDKKNEIVNGSEFITRTASKQKIEEYKQIRETRRKNLSLKSKLNTIQDKKTKEESLTPAKNIIDGETYTILSSVSFDSSKGCHLAKNEKGYFVYAYVGDKVLKLKEYQTLNSEKIQARMNEKLPDETFRYIIRIGQQKFIVDAKDNDIKYIMDL